MEVVSYKKLKGNVYQVSLDNGDEYKLYDDVILKYELLIDRKIDQKKLDRVLEENAELEAYYKALKFIGLKMRTELEIKRYLKRYEIPYKAINKAVDKLKKDGYIDSKRYVEAYVNDSLNLGLNGPDKIKDNLVKLGIKEDLIDPYLEKISSEVWRSRIESILNKKSKTNKAGLSLFKNKAYSYLYMLGYYQEDIREVLENYTFDTTDVFFKEADKVYDKLSTKYEGNELSMRFRAKMFSKGFESEKISDYLNKRESN